MKNRLLSTLLLTCLFTMAFGTASAESRQIESISLSGPVNSSVATTPDFSFIWSYVSAASNYKLNIQSADGTQRESIDVSPGNCISATSCVYFFDADSRDWEWREGAVYKWSIKAFDFNSNLVGKSVKFKLTVDMLPDVIQTTGPAHNSVNHHAVQTFTWDTNSRFSHYRLIITNENGFAYKSQWMYRENFCTDSCAMTYDFGAAANGKYTWKVVGKAMYVIGKTSSVKSVLKVKA